MTKSHKPQIKLKPDPKNARKHNERNKKMIRESLEEVGGFRSIAVDGNDIVRAGNGVYEQAQALGLKVRVVDAKPDELIAVRRKDLKGKKAERAALIDNRAAETSEWDADIIAEMARNEKDLLAGLFEEKELREIVKMADAGDGEQDAEPQIDRAAELNKKWKVKRGDLWKIGEHRLLCGDSTVREDVERVMGGAKAQMIFTDPPYGVNYDGGTKRRKQLDGDGNTELYMPCCRMAFDFSDEKSALYLWHAGIKGIAAAAAAAGYEIRCEIVWNKNLAQFGALSSQYKQKHEPCYYCFKRGKSARWFGPTNEVTVWDIDRASANEFHPTQKPIELAMRAMNNSSEQGDTILDLFLGSGATLIACENLKRKCRAMEIAPEYVAVVLERMATAFPNLKIERIEETHGTTGRRINKKRGSRRACQ